MRLLRFWRVGLGAAVALSVSLAFATDPVGPYPECTHKPTPADLDGAKGAHKAASQFYDRGDYEKAIRYWTDAYGFDCTAHGVLINIANAYEKQGDKPAAVLALETFIKRSGSDPTIEEKVKNLRLAMAPPAPPTASASASATPTAAPTVIPTTAPTVAAPTTPRPYGYTPLFVSGGGAVVALIGGVLLGVGSSATADADKLCPNRSACNNPDAVSNGNSGRTQQGVGAGGLVLGLAAVGGGLAWEFLFNKPRAAAAPTGLRVLPAAGPRDAGLSVSGSF
jgi:hypothetical protein